MGVGDGVVEAVGLDARGGLLPDAAGARLVGERAERFREMGSWSFEDDAQVSRRRVESCVVISAARSRSARRSASHLRVVGDVASEVALPLGGLRDFLLGEIEALAPQRALRGVRAPAPDAACGLVELGDACACFGGDTLRLCQGAAGGVKLVDEVLGG